MLKQIAPGVVRAAILRDPALGTGTSQFAVIQAAANSLGMNVNPVNMRNADEIESAIENFARTPNGGLIVTAGGAAHRHRDLIIALTDRYKLPAIYYERFFVTGGGLISYGASLIDQYQRAASYVDRILKGEKQADIASASTDKVRVGDQSQDRQGTRPRRAAFAARPRRRGDRIGCVVCCDCLTAGFGTEKPNLGCRPRVVAIKEVYRSTVARVELFSGLTHLRHRPTNLL